MIVELRQHGLVGVVCQGVAVGMHGNFRLQSRASSSNTNVEKFTRFVHSHVRWKLKKVDAHVCFHLFLIVDVQLFVGVD